MSEKITELIVGVLVVVLVSTITMTWISVFEINDLEKRVTALENRMDKLTTGWVGDNGITQTQSISLMHNGQYYEVFYREMRSAGR